MRVNFTEQILALAPQTFLGVRHGEGTRDARLRMSAGEANKICDLFAGTKLSGNCPLYTCVRPYYYSGLSDKKSRGH